MARGVEALPTLSSRVDVKENEENEGAWYTSIFALSTPLPPESLSAQGERLSTPLEKAEDKEWWLSEES